MIEWKKMKVGDAPLEIIDGDRGKNYPKKNEFFDSGFCLFLNAKNVTQTGFSFSEMNFITQKKDEILRKGKLKRGDLVLTTRGTVGNVAYYDKAIPYEHIRINSGMVIIRPAGIDERFNYYLFKSLNNQIKVFTSGTAQPQLPIRDLVKIPIFLPPLSVQRAISGFLSTFDEKIKLLHHQNETLEALAQTLFHQWFIEEAEDDWEEGVLPDEFDFTMGLSPPGSSYNENGIGTPMFQGNADFSFRFPTNRVYTTDPRRFAEKFDTLISVRAPVGAQNMAFEKCCIGRGVAAFRYKRNTNNYSYTYYKLNSIITEIRKFEDSGTVFGSINKSDFEALEVFIPPPELVDKFGNDVGKLDLKILNNSLQIHTLEKLRDMLLPKLISGEIRIEI